jgi:asparagine synthase (glutamine-hydrolysing)
VLRLYQLAYAIFVPSFQRRLLIDGIDPLPNGLPGELERRVRDESRDLPILQQISAIEQRLFLGERLLRDVDAASMAVSIETRLPLVDSVLTGQVARLTTADRYGVVGKKTQLARAGLIGLDPKLFDRPKSGFVIPFDRWIRATLGKAIDDAMRDANACRNVGLNPRAVADLWDDYQSGAPGLYWSRVWALYTLIRWGQRFGLAV